MAILHIDFEGGSAADLIEVGVHKYAQHWTTHVYCMAYRFDNGAKHIWYMREPFPQCVIDHVKAGGVVVAHNAAFERTMWNVVLRRPNRIDNLPALDLPTLTIRQMVCTLSRASALALPAGLDFVASVMGFANRKDEEGSKLMMKFARPVSRTLHPDGTETFQFHRNREDMLRVGDYCLQDVEVETDADTTLLHLTPRERRVWELDQTINDRGVHLDIAMCHAAVEVVEAAKLRTHARMNELTGGAVPKASATGKLAAWINGRGIPCASVAKGVQEEIVTMADEVGDSAVREALELRGPFAKGSPTSKYQTMIDCALLNGNACGQLFYSGTSTGRWAGRLVQFQNLPGMDEDRDGAKVRAAIAILGASHLTADEKAWALDMIAGSALPVLSRSIRQMLMASPGNRFIGGDLSNIEGCTAAWITDEEWKVEAYREFQRTGDKLLDLYRVAYGRGFGVPLAEITVIQRQVGKVMELSCSYQGSVGAFIGMCRNYGIKPQSMTKAIRDGATTEIWEAARAKMNKPGTKKFGLDEDTWTALRVAVDLWRAAHPAIVSAWWELQDAAIEAVENPTIVGEDGVVRPNVVSVLNGRAAYVYARQVLWVRLPSGRTMAYHRPRIKRVEEWRMTDREGKKAWASEEDVKTFLREGWQFVEDEKPRVKKQVFYEGFWKGRWDTNLSLYGGEQFANIVSGTARDVMVEWMFSAETAGYPIVLTVHDELLCDVPVGHGSAKGLVALLPKEQWFDGLPLAAKTWEDVRYAK